MAFNRDRLSKRRPVLDPGIQELYLKVFLKLFTFGYVSVIFLFYVAAVALIVFALFELWHGVNPTSSIVLRERFNAVLESIGLLTIAVVA
nr:hypothetical protein [Blastocatellia bacterium]